MFPVELVRLERAAPRGVGHPKKRRAILVHEVGAVARHTDRAVLAKGIAAERRGAAERAGEIVQTSVLLIRTGDLKRPFAGEIRQESNFPVVAAIPKAVDLVLLIGGRGEDGLKLHVLYRVVVRLEADQLALEARPLGQERQGLLRRCARSGET